MGSYELPPVGPPLVVGVLVGLSYIDVVDERPQNLLLVCDRYADVVAGTG